ncbi:alpha/beta hydrolase family esterase [Roseateles sp.]|uniref:extracellular catalytic domain type 1 short-chain-length polyhydroxyalkanoate depolymerase n=1 Tax=Roseateles sp. TaxID=1971397 RepID=UPI003BAD252D
MRGLLIALSLLTLLPAAQAQESIRERIKARMEQRRADKGDAPATAGLQELEVQGRKVLVHLPTRYDEAKPAPLVLAFHGGGGHAGYMADDEKYGLQKKADEAGFVVAFPNGYSKFPGGRLATWNAGGCCGDARDRNVDDVAFARAVVAAIQAKYAIDATRVFATGMSNGGMLVHRLACEAPDVFRAVASVAGTDATTSCAPSRPISVLHIHARDDDHVLFNGGAGPNAFRDERKVMAFVSVPETISRWVQRDHCATPAQRTLDTPGAFCETHTGCAGGTSVQLCVTDTGGHSWPGATTVRRGKAPASTALDANDVIWRFFETSSS